MVDSAPAVLNREHLERQTFGDEALAREVLGLFLRQSAKLSVVITSDAGPAERRDAAHGLKGAALGIGAFAVAGTAQALEGAADASRRERQHAIGALAAAIAQATVVIDDLLARPGDALFKSP